jgi:hypothetical protein
MRGRTVAMSASCALAIAGLAGAATPRIGMLTIRSLESNKPPVQAMFNPTELAINKKVAWIKAQDSTPDEPAAQFAGIAPAELEVTLTLRDPIDVRKVVARLDELAEVDEQTRRPPLVEVVWEGGLPPFKGVIESIGTKYTMFLPSGSPVRAVAHVKFRQAHRADGSRPCKADQECPQGQACVDLTCQAP